VTADSSRAGPPPGPEVVNGTPVWKQYAFLAGFLGILCAAAISFRKGDSTGAGATKMASAARAPHD
jgi:hypothetical protein